MQADYLRYAAVLALGGFYADVDFRRLADLKPLIPSSGHGRLFRGPKGNVINGLFAFGSPGHPFEVTVAGQEHAFVLPSAWPLVTEEARPHWTATAGAIFEKPADR
jgi:mannosyltransferase OCH1-like enzyme